MPAVADEFPVGADEEVVALGVVLADERHVGRVATAAELRVAPPPGEVAVGAAEFLVPRSSFRSPSPPRSRLPRATEWMPLRDR